MSSSSNIDHDSSALAPVIPIRADNPSGRREYTPEDFFKSKGLGARVEEAARRINALNSSGDPEEQLANAVSELREITSDIALVAKQLSDPSVSTAEALLFGQALNPITTLSTAYRGLENIQCFAAEILTSLVSLARSRRSSGGFGISTGVIKADGTQEVVTGGDADRLADALVDAGALDDPKGRSKILKALTLGQTGLLPTEASFLIDLIKILLASYSEERKAVETQLKAAEVFSKIGDSRKEMDALLKVLNKMAPEALAGFLEELRQVRKEQNIIQEVGG